MFANKSNIFPRTKHCPARTIDGAGERRLHWCVRTYRRAIMAEITNECNSKDARNGLQHIVYRSCNYKSWPHSCAYTHCNGFGRLPRLLCVKSVPATSLRPTILRPESFMFLRWTYSFIKWFQCFDSLGVCP